MNINRAELLLNFILILCFICIFYFTYVIYVEKPNFILQLNQLVDNIADDFKDEFGKISKEDKEKINSFLAASEKEITYTDSAYNNKINSLKNGFIYTCYALIILSVGLFYYFSGPSSINTILFAFFNVSIVLLLEFMFINIVSTNYISIDSVYVKKMIYNNIIDILN